MTNIVSDFIVWAEDYFGEWKPETGVAQSSEGDCETCFVRLQSNVGIGQITLWSSGDYSKEYLCFNEIEPPVMSLGKVQDKEEFSRVFSDILIFLKLV